MLDLNALPLAQLAEALLDGEEASRLFALAAYEDARDVGDITTASLIPPGRTARATVTARSAGTVAGMAVVQRYLAYHNMKGVLHPLVEDGDHCEANQPIAQISCDLAPLLQHERPVLNLLGRLSGIATLTRTFVDAIADSAAVVCDTRKTTPGLRVMEKYAVRCGGAVLHRVGLYDAALYKDNHNAHIPPPQLAERLADAAQAVRERHDVRFIEVEIDALEQLEQVLLIAPGLIDMVLLDNMTPEQLRKAAAMRDAARSGIKLEASGGVSLATVRDIAATGVDRIAVGAITHGASSLDMGLDMQVERSGQ